MIRFFTGLALYITLQFFTIPAYAIDPNCVPQEPSGILLCPEFSEDWFESYEGLVSSTNFQFALGRSATVQSDAPILGDGSSADPLRLDVTSVTLQGNSFNGADQLLKLDSSASVPFANLTPPTTAATLIQGEFSTTATDLNTCFSPSTTTILTNGGQIEFSFFGTLTNTGNNNRAYIGVLQDGAFFDGYGQDVPVRSIMMNSAGDDVPFSFKYRIDTAPAVGLHSYCLMIAAPDGGTTTLDCDLQDGRCPFQIKEIR